MTTIPEHIDALLDELEPYLPPEAIELGSVVELTGHCTSGCDHDSINHPNEFDRPPGC